MNRWLIDVPEDLHKQVQAHLAAHGGGELSQHVSRRCGGSSCVRPFETSGSAPRMPTRK